MIYSRTASTFYLFLFLINDLSLHITSNKVNCDMFADDTSLNTSDKNTDTVQKELQRSINEASDWCDNNAMILHPAKTKRMLLTTKQKHQLRLLHLNLSLKDSHTEQVHEHRHLGVIIGDEFSWRPHIIGTCKTVSKDLYLLSQLRHFVDTPKRKPFYHAHISPHLTYASTVWDGCSDILTHLILLTEELQQIQSYGTWEYFHSKKSLCSIRQC